MLQDSFRRTVLWCHGALDTILVSEGGVEAMTAPRSIVLPQYDRFEVAYLAGGTNRLVDTAVVTLLEADRIRVRPTGEIHGVGLHGSHPVEAAVLDAVGSRGKSMITLRWRLTEDQRIRAVADRLAADGLMTPPGRRGLLRRPVTEGTRTAEGRRVLRRLRAEDPAGFEVALHGISRVPDQHLRETVSFIATAPHRGRPRRDRTAEIRGSRPDPWWLQSWGWTDTGSSYGSSFGGGFSDGGCSGFDGGGGGDGGGSC
jgi:uncharacterized membrane protein YgcG